MANNTNLTTSYADHTEHTMAIIAGLGGPLVDLQYGAPVHADHSILPGALVSIDPTTGKWVNGLAIDQAMPCFSVNNSGEEDIAQHEYGFGKGTPPTLGTSRQTAEIGDGDLSTWLNAIVAIRGYELVTTEFDRTSVYKAQDLLIPDATAGKIDVLLPASYDGSQSVVGQVTRGLVTFDARKNPVRLTNVTMLAFWTRTQLPIS